MKKQKATQRATRARSLLSPPLSVSNRTSSSSERGVWNWDDDVKKKETDEDEDDDEDGGGGDDDDEEEDGADE